MFVDYFLLQALSLKNPGLLSWPCYKGLCHAISFPTYMPLDRALSNDLMLVCGVYSIVLVFEELLQTNVWWWQITRNEDIVRSHITRKIRNKSSTKEIRGNTLPDGRQLRLKLGRTGSDQSRKLNGCLCLGTNFYKTVTYIWLKCIPFFTWGDSPGL